MWGADAGQGSVHAGPALGLHVLAQRCLDLALAARAEFECDAILRSSPESLAHIVAADDQIAAVIGAAAHQHLDLGIVCVPVIDGYPVERCYEIALGVSPQFAGDGVPVLHFDGLLGRDDDPRTSPVSFATRRD